jgi:hypothetical protein
MPYCFFLASHRALPRALVRGSLVIFTQDSSKFRSRPAWFQLVLGNAFLIWVQPFGLKKFIKGLDDRHHYVALSRFGRLLCIDVGAVVAFSNALGVAKRLAQLASQISAGAGFH